MMNGLYRLSKSLLFNFSSFIAKFFFDFSAGIYRICSRRLMGPTDQADPSFFYFRIS